MNAEVFKGRGISALTSKKRSKNAKDCVTNIQQSLEMETNLSLVVNKSGICLINNLKALKNTITDLTVPHDGGTILLPRRIRHHDLRHHDGNQAATGSQLGAGIRGKHHSGLNSNFFSSLIVQRCHFAYRKFNLLAIDGWYEQYTYRAPLFLMHSCCAVSLQSCCRSVYSHIDPTHLHGSSHEAHCLRFAQKHSHLILVAQCRKPCRT